MTQVNNEAHQSVCSDKAFNIWGTAQSIKLVSLSLSLPTHGYPWVRGFETHMGAHGSRDLNNHGCPWIRTSSTGTDGKRLALPALRVSDNRQTFHLQYVASVRVVDVPECHHRPNSYLNTVSRDRGALHYTYDADLTSHSHSIYPVSQHHGAKACSRSDL